MIDWNPKKMLTKIIVNVQTTNIFHISLATQLLVLIQIN